MQMRLHDAITDLLDPMVVMRRVVDEALSLIPAADGAVVELVDEDHLAYVCGAGALAEHVGTRLQLRESLSGLAVRLGNTVRCDDAATDARVDREACLRVGAVSMVCVPLHDDREPFGVLKVSAAQPNAFSATDVEILATLAAFIGATIAAAGELTRVTARLLSRQVPAATALGSTGGGLSPTAEDDPDRVSISHFVANVLRPGLVHDAEIRSRIERMLATRDLSIVYQPLIDLCNGELVGAEALTRFNAVPHQPPDAWFAQAEHVGLGVELELTAIRVALQAIDEIPPDAYLAVNVSAPTIGSPELARLVHDAGAERVVLELTEHLEVEDYPRLRKELCASRECGARLAVDDTGAGFASLGHILKLAPDIIKLDRELIGGIDLDPVRRALARALVSLAGETGAEVIAEGLETEDELQTVRDLGIQHGQGYLLGRPGPVRALARRNRRATSLLSAGRPSRLRQAQSRF